MRLATFRHAGEVGVGVVDIGSIAEIGTVFEPLVGGQVRSVQDLIPLGIQGLEIAYETAQAAKTRHIDLSEVQLLAPVSRPPKMLYIGRNYKDHAEEAALDVLGYPSMFAKFPTNVIGPDDEIICPKMSSQVDYEGELAVVVGERASNVAAEEALSVVYGYTVANDISARDIQLRDKQITIGKNFPTFAPLGPWIITADELKDPHTLTIRTLLNGEMMQQGSTSDMIFDVQTIISFLSELTVLEPGDIISTGTPAGIGFARSPQVFLQPGDEIAVEIDAIGVLRNRVVGP